ALFEPVVNLTSIDPRGAESVDVFGNRCGAQEEVVVTTRQKSAFVFVPHHKDSYLRILANILDRERMTVGASSGSRSKSTAPKPPCSGPTPSTKTQPSLAIQMTR